MQEIREEEEYFDREILEKRENDPDEAISMRTLSAFALIGFLCVL